MYHIQKYTLQNGLRIVHLQDKGTEMVALNLMYNVGSKDESPEHTGFAHLFEHLMFGGSEHIPDYDVPLQLAGGENNAWTNKDVTDFYLTVPKQNVEIGFWLESDRMLGLEFNEKSLEVQRAVVVEEFKQTCLNQPYGDVEHIIGEMAFKVHPYQWPTIGKCFEHIEQATMEQVKDFFYHYYAPNNCVLAVTGNISFEEAVRLSEKWFGEIPAREVRERHLPCEPGQTEIRRKEVRRNVSLDALYMAFHMCDRMHPDFYAYDAMSDVLSHGKSSRLYQHLVIERKLFSSIDAYISGTIDNGLFKIYGNPSPGISLEEAEKAVWQELDILKGEYVSDRELEKVKNKFESGQVLENISYLTAATNLAYYEMIGRAEDLYNQTDIYRKVNREQLQRVAKDCFIPDNVSILYYKRLND
jgi:zinc protease